MKIKTIICAGTAFLVSCLGIHAVTILSGPTFTPAANAPLAGLLSVTTDVKSRVSVLIDNGTSVLEKDFYDYDTTHAMPLLGFKPGQTNQILVTVYDADRSAFTASQSLTFVTTPLPVNFPTYTVLKNEPDQMEPGYMLMVIGHAYAIGGSYITVIDNNGNVVWYSAVPTTGTAYQDVRQLDNGDLFLQLAPPSNEFIEINMLGQIVNTWQPPAQYPINLHEGLVTSHGTIMYISDAREVVSNFPTSDTIANPPLVTTNVDDNPIVEISYTNSALINVWSPLNFLDPTRVTYLTYGEYSGGSSYGVDNEHLNALFDDTNDNSIIFSSRVQNAVFKLSRSTGELKWILGPHALWGTDWQQYLLTPVGDSFNWNYGQHAPEVTPQGTVLLFNDNPYQASPFDTQVADQNNYSSAVEYSIDETNMTVSEVWNSAWQTNQDRLYAPIVGRAQWLPQTRNVFVTYGYVTYVNGAPPNSYAPGATMVRLIEYTHDPVPQVVYDISFFDYGNTSPTYLGYTCYRAYQIPDLYAHPLESVADLTVRDEDQIPVLEFSADPTHNYLIQASTDLINWTTIGSPVQEGGTGDYDFEDLNANQFQTRFYRVVSQ
ncbi:MAG TPA: aryl-sulfate sulfotransferase [Verrucomicrobiae bacterium]|nr:aryl-sulfate sulfotransferase [Verrucomicrobiae bacterium]